MCFKLSKGLNHLLDEISIVMVSLLLWSTSSVIGHNINISTNQTINGENNQLI